MAVPVRQLPSVVLSMEELEEGDAIPRFTVDSCVDALTHLGGAGTISNGSQQQPSVEGGVQEAAEEGGSHFVSELFRRAGESSHV